MQAIDANLPVTTVASGDRGGKAVPAPAPAVARAQVQVPVAQHAASVPNVPDAEQVRKAIAAANEALKAASSSLEFAEDPTTGKTLVRIIDSKTHQVIRQLPSEEMLSIARAIDRMQGLLLKEKA